MGAERPYKHLGRSLPRASRRPRPYGALRYAPPGNELTLEFAKELVKQEKVGPVAADMLAMRLLDQRLHRPLGPDSLKSEEGVLRLDATLAGLFAFPASQTVQGP